MRELEIIVAMSEEYDHFGGNEPEYRLQPRDVSSQFFSGTPARREFGGGIVT